MDDEQAYSNLRYLIDRYSPSHDVATQLIAALDRDRDDLPPVRFILDALFGANAIQVSASDREIVDDLFYQFG